MAESIIDEGVVSCVFVRGRIVQAVLVVREGLPSHQSIRALAIGVKPRSVGRRGRQGDTPHKSKRGQG
jgi:hypothetical protein